MSELDIEGVHNGAIDNSPSSDTSYQNNGYHDEADVSLPVPSSKNMARRLPPIDLEAAKAHKSIKGKSPQTPQYLTVETGNDDGQVSPASRHRRKHKGKHRPRSAEKPANELTGNGHNEDMTPRPGGDSTGSQSNGILRSTPPNGHEPALAAASGTNGVSRNGVEANQSVRPKDPSRHVRVVADIEPSQIEQTSSLPIVTKPILQSETAPSQQRFEDGGTDDVDAIDSISVTVDDPSVRYSKAAGQSILKPSNDLLTSMFQAGSQPASASSSKPSVRIADEVSYSTDEPHKAKASSKPRSARSGKRSTSTIKHSNGTQHRVGSGQPENKLSKTTQRKISPHIKTSIFTLLACGVFAGAAALYFSFKAKSALREGDEKEAMKNARYSKIFNGVGIGFGIFIAVVVVIYYNVAYNAT